jgi:predicted dehydrogenase
MSKIRFAIIGAGHIGKRHAEMVLRHPEGEIVAMSDIRSKEECGVSYDIPFFSDPADMINNGPACDVVCMHPQRTSRSAFPFSIEC